MKAPAFFGGYKTASRVIKTAPAKLKPFLTVLQELFYSHGWPVRA